MELLTAAAFALVALVAIVTPGPTVLLALANGSRFGVRRATFGMLGAVASDVVLVLAVALGLGAVFAASELIFSIVKWVGVAYLVYLGVMLLRSKGTLGQVDQQENPRGGSRRSVFLKSFVVAVTNPKGYLFVGALLPQFIDPARPQVVQYVAIGILFCAIDFVVMFAYAVLGTQAVRLLRRRGVVWIDRICGTVLLGLAASLAFIRRANA
ncbi:LysE family translocator [Microbacterium sp.]|uniref:LysE family translocator n=1 Tax=Microbacterium sp. TaxID=51671 RepID=UPI002811104A|nr:LysE family translocator [Microbacterium sp.]